jgi:hypothetical protein
MLKLLIFIMFVHWLADFVCQPSKMAQNKSKNILVLAGHAVVYGAVLLYSMLFLSLRYEAIAGLEQILQFGLINMVLHFITDGITSQFTRRLWEKQYVHGFFTMIGFDQFIHFTTLAITAKMFLIE